MGRSTHEVNAGGSNTAECPAETVGLTLADGKRSRDGGAILFRDTRGNRFGMSGRGGCYRCSERPSRLLGGL
jgi:hypothetical protein